MALPWLKQDKKVAGLIVEMRKPDGGLEETAQEDSEDTGIESCAQDLIKAVEGKDAKAVAQALKSAFEILDSQPHSEGPHEEESDSE